MGPMGLMGPIGPMSNRPLLISPIGPIGPIKVCPIKPLPSPVGEAGAGHFLADAAAFEEVALEAVHEAAEHHVGLVDEGDGDVGHGLVRALAAAHNSRPRTRR